MVIGSAELADGSVVKGFLCEPWSTEGGEEVTAFGVAARLRLLLVFSE